MYYVADEYKSTFTKVVVTSIKVETWQLHNWKIVSLLFFFAQAPTDLRYKLTLNPSWRIIINTFIGGIRVEEILSLKKGQYNIVITRLLHAKIAIVRQKGERKLLWHRGPKSTLLCCYSLFDLFMMHLRLKEILLCSPNEKATRRQLKWN